MSGEAAVAVRSWPVGERTCTVTMQRLKPGAVVHMVVEWSPSQPKRLTADEWAQYRTGRNSALADIAVEMGINAAVLEL